MEITFIEDRKDSAVIDLKGEEHTFPGLICWALLKDSAVSLAVYDVPHPLIGTPRLYVKTKDEAPRDALKKALKLIQKEIDSVDEAVGKIRATAKAKGKK